METIKLRVTQRALCVEHLGKRGSSCGVAVCGATSTVESAAALAEETVTLNRIKKPIKFLPRTLS